MRIITGSAKGRRLRSPKGNSIRPTADRVREAMFNIIGARISDALFIDFFSGSGAVGIEALSRGAAMSIFVEEKTENINLINQNLLITNLKDKARVEKNDVSRAINKLARENVKADLIFLDPPYNYSCLKDLVLNLLRKGLSKNESLIIVEHAYRNSEWAEQFAGKELRKYGDSALTFITVSAQDEQKE